jgi:hypothetical protein
MYILKILFYSSAKDNNIVNIYSNKVAVVIEEMVYKPLSKCRYILETYKDDVKSFKALVANNNYLVSIFLYYR